MKNIKYIWILLISIFLISCATTYKQKGIMGGYSEEKILSNMYKVEFEGNQHTKPEMVQNYLLYRCAELTKENGFEYFAIVSEERHFDEHSVRPDRDQAFSTRTTMSGGTNTTVNADLQTASKSTNYTGVYFIKFLEEIDEKYKNAVFNVDEVFTELSEFVR